jgi:hypothetical protein
LVQSSVPYRSGMPAAAASIKRSLRGRSAAHKVLTRLNFSGSDGDVHEERADFSSCRELPANALRGTERIASYSTEGLVADGHEVTLFATGDSVTEAELVAPQGVALRLDRSNAGSQLKG